MIVVEKTIQKKLQSIDIVDNFAHTIIIAFKKGLFLTTITGRDMHSA